MSLNNKKILVIDDAESIRAFLRICFVSQQAQLFEAATGHDGLQQAMSVKPDAIILDLGLPDIDGLELLPKLLQAITPPPPVFVLSVRREQETVASALKLGAHSYMTKPFSPTDLLHQIDSYFA